MLSPSPLPRTLEASLRDLGSGRDTTRASAVRDLVRHALRSPETRDRAIPLLERALAGDASAAVRAAAAVALADLGASPALPSLLVAVEDDDAYVRQMALTALGEIGDARARPRIERALRDRRPEVRYQAIIAFARVAGSDPAAVAESLATALDDEDEEIQYIAMRLAEEHGVAGELPRLAAGLVDEAEPALAVVAALYLARRGDPRGRAIVLDVVAERRGTPILEDEQACVELAGELAMQDAIPYLERRAWGTRRALRHLLSWGSGDRASCAWHARTSLAQMGHARATGEIRADLSAWRRETREAAAIAAARSGIDLAGTG
jgi:hypothetical protein